MKVERREHERLLLKDSSFAALGSNYARVGKIKNISRGGLAFEYIAGESGSRDSSQVDIFMTGDVFHMHHVPCRLVYEIDVRIPNVHDQYVKILTTKRCGLAFAELSEADRAKLEFFIEAHTDGNAQPKNSDEILLINH